MRKSEVKCVWYYGKQMHDLISVTEYFWTVMINKVGFSDIGGITLLANKDHLFLYTLSYKTAVLHRLQFSSLLTITPSYLMH